MKKTCKAMMALLLAMVLTAAVALPVSAQSRMKYIDSVSASLGIIDNVAYCTITGIVPDMDCTYTCTFYKSKDAKTWTKVKSWSGKAYQDVFDSWSYGDNPGEAKLIDGMYYRFNSVIYAKSTAGTTLESMGANSGAVECGSPDEFSISEFSYEAVA